MSLFGEWIYWLQFIGVVLIVAAGFAVAVALLGWERVKGFLLPVLGLLAVFGYRAHLQQSGYNDRRAEEEKALDKAEEIVEDERSEVKTLPDVEVDEEIDKWTRK